MRFITRGARLLILVALSSTAAFATPRIRSSGAQDARYSAEGLADQLAISEKLQLYPLLHDGDGQSSDAKAWAEAIFTTDATFQAHWPDGTLLVPSDPRGIVGRANIVRIFGASPTAVDGSIARHFIGTPVFDKLTRSEAQTRTTELVVHGPVLRRLAESGQAEAASPPVEVYIFHDSWRKGADGQWRKSRMDAYCVMNCRPFSLPIEVLK